MKLPRKNPSTSQIASTQPDPNQAAEVAALKSRIAELEELLHQKDKPPAFTLPKDRPNTSTSKTERFWQRESDEQVRFALEAAGIGTWEWNILKNEVKWSSNMGSVFGLPTGSIVPTYEGFLNIIHPPDRQVFVETVRRAFQEAGNFEVEFRVVRPDESFRWCVGKGKIISNETGQPSRMLGVIYDIHDLKHTTESLRFLVEASHTLTSSLDYHANLQQLAALAVPQLADWCMVFVQEKEGEVRQLAVVHADPARTAWALEFQSNYPYDTDIGRELQKDILQVVRTGQPQFLPEMTDEMLVAIAINDVHLQWMRELGPRSKMAVPLVARNRILGVISFITSRESGRNFTPADLELAQELARQVGQAIDNSRLYQQAQEAIQAQRELDHLKDQFLSIASHELRTPLTTIKGYSQILHRDLLRLHPANLPVVNQVGSREMRILSNVVGQVGRMELLINEMLDISRIQSGQFRLKLNPQVDLNTVVRRVVEQQQDADNDHPLLFQPYQAELIGNWDETRLEQVLNNLISNALKYSPAGSPVEVGLEYDERANEGIVWVRDQGIGISPEHQGHIFDRFYRARTPMNVNVDGLGLGLFISFETIKQHSGRMWLDSELEKGSTFYFSLPLSEAEDADGTEVAS